jgi:hypothetical protein
LRELREDDANGARPNPPEFLPEPIREARHLLSEFDPDSNLKTLERVIETRYVWAIDHCDVRGPCRDVNAEGASGWCRVSHSVDASFSRFPVAFRGSPQSLLEA